MWKSAQVNKITYTNKPVNKKIHTYIHMSATTPSSTATAILWQRQCVCECGGCSPPPPSHSIPSSLQSSLTPAAATAN